MKNSAEQNFYMIVSELWGEKIKIKKKLVVKRGHLFKVHGGPSQGWSVCRQVGNC